MKRLNIYYSFLLVTILLVYVIIDYKDLQQLIAQTEEEGIIVDFVFGGWEVLVSFIIITLFELILKNRLYKLLIRVFLTLILMGLLFSKYIPIEDFISGVENTAVFSGFIAIILFLALGIKRLYLKIFK